jgi:hypothetical protein
MDNNMEVFNKIKEDVYKLFVEEYDCHNEQNVIYQLDKIIKMLNIALKAAKMGQNINMS